MKFAYIKLLKSNEKKIVNTKNLIDFKNYMEKPSNKDVYLLRENSYMKSCVVLVTGETQAEVQEIIDLKRIPDPKINNSDITHDIEDSYRPLSEAMDKRQRAKDIVKHHKRARVEEHINSKSIENINPLPVTSEQDILEVISDPTPGPSRQVLSDTNNIPPVGEGDNIAAGTVRGDNIYLGRQVWIKESAYDIAINKRDAAKFIATMAFAIWGHDDLANRCVKKIEGRKERPVLEKSKVAVLRKYYSIYLKNRKCDSYTYRREQDQFNLYVGRAIASAQNTLQLQDDRFNNV